MTMRTRTNYVCECGHSGYSIMSENDQPYSKMWQRLEVFGFAELEGNEPLARRLQCPGCGEAGKVRIQR